MGMMDRLLTIEELADQVGVPVRTIRYYITEGLLPGPGARGKGALYSDEHLLRLQLIRRLSEQRVPLAEIRERLGRLSFEEIRSLLAEEVERAAELERAAKAPTPKEYVSALLRRAEAARQRRPLEGERAATDLGARSTQLDNLERRPEPFRRRRVHAVGAWERWQLAPGVELHIRADARDSQRHLIERLLREADVESDHPGR